MGYFDNLYTSSNDTKKTAPTVNKSGGYFSNLFVGESSIPPYPEPTISVSQPQPSSQLKIGNITLNGSGITSWASGLKDRLLNNFKRQELPKIEPVKLPDGFKIDFVEPKKSELFDISPAKESSSAKLTAESKKKVAESQSKVSKKVSELTSSINNFLINEGKRVQRDFNSLVAGGVVSNKNQVAPREEYFSQADYDAAVARSKQKTVLDIANKWVANLAAGVGTTLTLGKLAPDQKIIDSMDKGERITYTAGQLLPLVRLVASPSGLKMLAKFLAVDFALTGTLKATTGKEKISQLLPEDTSPVVTNAVDILEFLGKAYIAHGIKPGEIADSFTKATIEKYNLPKEITLTGKQIRDIHQTGLLTTAEEKQLLRSLQLTSKEYTNLVKSGEDVTIKVPSEKIVQLVDKPWWSKVKSLFGRSSSSPVTISVTQDGTVVKTQSIAGLLPAGEYTPKEVQSAVIGSALENTTQGKALIKASVNAESAGKNVQIKAPEIRNANKEFNKANTEKITNETIAGNREEFRLDSPKAIQKYASSTALGTTDPNATVEVFRWAKDGQEIQPGNYVALAEEALNKYRLRNPDPSFSVVTSKVQVKDLVGGGGLRVEAIFAPKASIAPESVKVPTEFKPKQVKEPKARFVPTVGIPKLAQGVRRNAIKNKLTYGFDKTFLDLPEYDRVNVKDQASKATELLFNDPDRAFRIAMGQENPPGDILPESVFVAVEKYAIETRNVDVMRELATRSELTQQATGMGQRIRLLAERDTDSPVKAIRDVQDARRKAVEAKSKTTVKKATQKVVKEIKKSIKAPDKHDWGEFIKSIEC